MDHRQQLISGFVEDATEFIIVSFLMISLGYIIYTGLTIEPSERKKIKRRFFKEYD